LAILKETPHTARDFQKIVNLSWLPGLGLSFGAAFLALIMYVHDPVAAAQNLQQQQQQLALAAVAAAGTGAGAAAATASAAAAAAAAANVAAAAAAAAAGGGADISMLVVLLYCLGALLECCSEPWLNLCQLRLSAGPKGVCVCACACACARLMVHI
jgi:hypothetical protein